MIIESPLGKFEVRDDRGSDPENVASVFPADDQGQWTGNQTVVINSRHYSGPIYLKRYTRGGEEYKIISGPGWGNQLTDAARRKLEMILVDVWAMFPPLTHAEKVDHVIDSVRSRTRSRLDHEVGRIVSNILDDYNMMQHHSHRHSNDQHDPVTDAELAKINKTVLAEVRAWIREQEKK